MVRVAPKPSGNLAYPYGRVSSDEEVLAAVLNALYHSCGVPLERVEVEVRHGHAVLSGQVKEEFERNLAEQTAATAPGVLKITNEITVESG